MTPYILASLVYFVFGLWTCKAFELDGTRLTPSQRAWTHAIGPLVMAWLIVGSPIRAIREIKDLLSR